MGLFDWIFGKSTRSPLPGKKQYEYPTGNIELGMRVQRGEFLMAVMEDIKPRWTPGNEYLWDEYDPESLLDTPEKANYMVNALLFGRLTVYRALRAAGCDVRGTDPFDFTDQVPEVMAKLRKRFPSVFGDAPSPSLKLEVRPLTLSPGDPGVPLDKGDTPSNDPQT